MALKIKDTVLYLGFFKGKVVEKKGDMVRVLYFHERYSDSALNADGEEGGGHYRLTPWLSSNFQGLKKIEPEDKKLEKVRNALRHMELPEIPKNNEDLF